jgi:uncharacterized protein YbjT (DUF2867 family)
VGVPSRVRVLLFGGSGMVGQSALRACLLDPTVTEVLAVGRRAIGPVPPKLRDLVVPDVGELSSVEDQLRGFAACFWCLGVASGGMTEAEYRKVTYDLTVSAARTLARLNPGMTFIYVSGAGTDPTGRGRAMWARVKGQTENALLAMPLKAYMIRLGLLRSMHGIRSRTRSYRILYAVLWPLLLLVRAVAPNSTTTTDRLGRAFLQIARTGAPDRIVTTRDLNVLGA